MHPWRRDLKGKVEEHWIESRALQGNPLGDPHRRPLWVYQPPAYAGGQPLPVVYVLQGLTGQVDMWANRSSMRPTVLERFDELLGGDQTPPVLLVLVDAWTSLGGSQYLDSPAVGSYHTYLCEEIVPFVDREYRTLPAREHRALQGKSSGGYGAMVTAMLRPDLFGALASHAGDALFEHCYLPDLSKTARTLRDEYRGSYDAFWEDFRSRPAFSKEHDFWMLNAYCMAACYSAGRLPFDTATGRLIEDVWAEWLAWDPVRMAARHAQALRSMRGIYLDAGKADEYYLDLGAQAFAAELDRLGVPHQLELFEAKHGGIEYRYPLSLAYLAQRIA